MELEGGSLFSLDFHLWLPSQMQFLLKKKEVNLTMFLALHQKFKTGEQVDRVFYLSNKIKMIEIRHKN